MKFLEYGSGESTLFFARRVNELVSIEHHEIWYSKIKEKLMKNGNKNVDYLLCKPDHEETRSDLEKRHKLDYDHELNHYRSYYEKVKTYPDQYFDFILVDGRARVECCQRLGSKLKSGGVLIVDNSERKRYGPIHLMFSNWPKVNTTTGLTDTTFWFKP